MRRECSVGRIADGDGRSGEGDKPDPEGPGSVAEDGRAPYAGGGDRLAAPGRGTIVLVDADRLGCELDGGSPWCPAGVGVVDPSSCSSSTPVSCRALGGW